MEREVADNLMKLSRAHLVLYYKRKICKTYHSDFPKLRDRTKELYILPRMLRFCDEAASPSPNAPKCQTATVKFELQFHEEIIDFVFHILRTYKLCLKMETGAERIILTEILHDTYARISFVTAFHVRPEWVVISNGLTYRAFEP